MGSSVKVIEPSQVALILDQYNLMSVAGGILSL